MKCPTKEGLHHVETRSHTHTEAIPGAPYNLCEKRGKQLIIGTGLLTSISDKQSPTISEVMDYGYLRNKEISSFLIAGSNALNFPLETLKFMQEFEF